MVHQCPCLDLRFGDAFRSRNCLGLNAHIWARFHGFFFWASASTLLLGVIYFCWSCCVGNHKCGLVTAVRSLSFDIDCLAIFHVFFLSRVGFAFRNEVCTVALVGSMDAFFLSDKETTGAPLRITVSAVLWSWELWSD